MKKIFQTVTLFALSALTIVSCKKDEAPQPSSGGGGTGGYTVLTTYAYSKVNYSGQTFRIMMLDEIGNYIKTGNTIGVTLDAQIMKDMYANVNNRFTDTTLNNSGKALRNKTYASDQTLFDAYFDSVAINSQSVTAGSNGVAGVVTSTTDGTKKYLQNERGFEFAQIIKKGLQGAVFYYQAINTYLDNLAFDDNTTVNADGTAMEHHFDEAFGYFGVPIDFPTNLTGLKYWGAYCDEVNPALGTNTKMMNAFLKARAAISNKDYTTRDAQVTIIKSEWEKIVAASAILELNEAKAFITDDALRNHYLSEAIGFIMSLKYNTNRKISDTQIQQALDYIGTNLYNVSTTNIDNARNLISSIYGLDSVKDIL